MENHNVSALNLPIWHNPAAEAGPAGANTCLLKRRKSPTSSVCSMLSEGIRNGCSMNVSTNSAITTVRSNEASASGSVGKVKMRHFARHLA